MLKNRAMRGLSDRGPAHPAGSDDPPSAEKARVEERPRRSRGIGGKHMRRQAVILLITFLAAAAGCGTSGDSETTYVCYEGETRWATLGGGAVASDLTGSYSLQGFTENWMTVFGNDIRVVTEADWTSFAGTFDIYGASAYGAITVTGRVPLLSTESARSKTTWYLTGGTTDFIDSVNAVSWSSATGGVISYASGFSEGFEVAGDVLSTFSSGCIPLLPTEEDVPLP